MNDAGTATEESSKKVLLEQRFVEAIGNPAYHTEVHQVLKHRQEARQKVQDKDHIHCTAVTADKNGRQDTVRTDLSLDPTQACLDDKGKDLKATYVRGAYLADECIMAEAVTSETALAFFDVLYEHHILITLLGYRRRWRRHAPRDIMQ